MDPWCSPNDVAALVKGDPPVLVVQDFCTMASNLLWVLSGRRFSGPRPVTAQHQVSIRGYVVLTPWQPVDSVTSFQIDGVDVPYVLSPAGTFIAVDRLYRLKVATVGLITGQNPPLEGIRAAAYLAADMLRSSPEYAMTGADDVKPDSRLLSIARQGVTYTYTDVSKVLDKGRTGIWVVDLFLQSSNPKNMRYQPKVVLP